VSPSTDGSVFAADRVVKPVSKEDSSIGDSDILLVADFDLLLAVVVVHFEGEVVDGVHALGMVVSGFDNFYFGQGVLEGELHFVVLAQCVGRQVVAFSAVGGQVG
jgi:hypothetical protein